MAQVMLLGQAQEDQLVELRKHGERTPLKAGELIRLCSTNRSPVESDPRCLLDLPGGMRVVFTVEDQPRGYYRHASFSVEPHAPGRLPNVQFVWHLLPLLGFEGVPPRWSGAQAWIEKEHAVHFLQRVSAGTRIG